MIEQIYQDFTTKFLPTIEKGLVISKDYFTDLFGRYIKYLIVMDSLGAVVSLTVLIGGIYFLRSKKQVFKDLFFEDWCMPYYSIMIPLILGSCMSLYLDITNLVQDIYLPELRVYQELQYIIKK